MVGIHYELIFQVEEGSGDGRYAFTAYGPTLEETKAWGEKRAWDFIHGKRPARYALKTLKSSQVADYLLTEDGRQPLDFAEVRKLIDGPTLSKLRSLELHESLFIRPSKISPKKEQWPEHLTFSSDIQDPATHALYVLIILAENLKKWSEVVYCRASNIQQAGRLWAWHSRKEWDCVRPARLGRAFGFTSADDPPTP
jgi:hypothetical protein